MDNIHCQLPVVCSSFKSTSAYCSLFWSLGLGVPVSLDGGWTIFIVSFLWSVLEFGSVLGMQTRDFAWSFWWLVCKMDD